MKDNIYALTVFISLAVFSIFAGRAIATVLWAAADIIIREY